MRDRPHVCETCSKCFGTISALSKHVRSVHHKDRPYTCETCFKAFAKKIGLVRHLRKEHNVEDADISMVTVPRTRTNPVRSNPLSPLRRPRPEQPQQTRTPNDTTSPMPFFPDLEQHPIYTDGAALPGALPVRLPPMVSPATGSAVPNGRAAPVSAAAPSPKRRRTSVSAPRAAAALVERAKLNGGNAARANANGVVANGANILNIAELDDSIAPTSTSPFRARVGTGLTPPFERSREPVKNDDALFADVKPATAEQMTLDRAYLELKLLDQEIVNRTEQFAPVTKQKRNGKLVSTRLTQTTFNMRASAGWQSLRNLMARKRRIKSAMLVANATAKVTVCGEEYTMAEAVEMKGMMAKEKEIVAETRKKIEMEKQSIDDMHEQNNWRLAKLLEATYGAKEDPLSAEDYEAVAGPYKKDNDVELFDPLNCEGLLKELEEKADAFLASVDACIAAANLTTIIQL